MHIPDGVLSFPTTLAANALALGGLTYALGRLKGQHRDKTVVLMGTMSAFVFAAQMVNFTLYPFPVSGHLLGGVLASVMLGPWAGAGVIAVVLIVQCLLAGDGGLLALGANFVNMGLIGAVGGYAIYLPIRRAIGGRAGILMGAMAAAWFSVILAAAAFSTEFAASGNWSSFLTTLGWMALVHAAIGLGEAVITGLVLKFVLMVRPDLIDDPDADQPPSPQRRWLQVGVGGLGIALAVVIFLAPLASTYADGLEYVGEKLQFPKDDTAPALVPAPLPDYELPGLGGSKPLATALAGLIGTTVVFGLGLGMARGFTKSESTPFDQEKSVDDEV